MFTKNNVQSTDLFFYKVQSAEMLVMLTPVSLHIVDGDGSFNSLLKIAYYITLSYYLTHCTCGGPGACVFLDRASLYGRDC